MHVHGLEKDSVTLYDPYFVIILPWIIKYSLAWRHCWVDRAAEGGDRVCNFLW